MMTSMATLAMATRRAMVEDDGFWHKVRIDFDGDLDAAIRTAKNLGGRIAAQVNVPKPVVRWYSVAYVPTEIIKDTVGIDNLYIGFWGDPAWGKQR